MFSFKPPRPTFRSYLLPPPQTDDQMNSEPKIKKLEPVLLPGEIVVNEVSFVRKCIATDTSQYDLWGKLICSNFKISFITDDPMPLQKFHYRNLLLGEHDVPLTCIDQIVTVNDHKRKQKVLGPNQKLKFNPTELIIYCKDFRIVRFRFDESGPESAKKPSTVQSVCGTEFRQGWKARAAAAPASVRTALGPSQCIRALGKAQKGTRRAQLDIKLQSDFEPPFPFEGPLLKEGMSWTNNMNAAPVTHVVCAFVWDPRDPLLRSSGNESCTFVIPPPTASSSSAPAPEIHHCARDRTEVCLAIAHYSQPTDLQLLFAFEYVGKKYHNSANQVSGTPTGAGGGSSSQKTPLFETYSDWDREIKRTGASGWRVCSINEGYMISTCLPEYFVVPSSLADQDLKIFSHSFVGRRMPLWSWSHWNGSAVVRMALIRDVLQQRKIDQRICNAITKSHPQRSDVYKSDLDKTLPNIQEIQVAFVKLKQLCVNEPFEETEEKWLSSLESTRWLEYVRAFLRHSAELVFTLESKRVSVVLQEEEGRDLSCVVASLVQVMLDPYFRTIPGFQSLIQKEWVMAGYQFLDRCNHLKRSEKESPLFLLFLDATWQLLEQYPAAFEFSETYLAVLGDSTHISLFGTFLFNSPHQRVKQSTEFAISRNIQLGDEKGLKFPSVWDWSLQFTAKDRTLFLNPSYVGKSTPCMQNGAVKSFRRTKKNYSSTLRRMPAAFKNGVIDREILPRRNSFTAQAKPDPLPQADSQDGGMERFFREWFSKPADLHGVLLPHVSGTHIKLWKLCYFRWVPEAQINRGGSITAFHKLSLLADEVDVLSRTLRQHRAGPLEACYAELDQSRMYFRASGPHDTSGTPDYLSSSFPFSPVGNLCRRSISGTPLSKFLSGAKIWLSTETLANED